MSGASLAPPDITLHLDDRGVIREAALSPAIADEGFDAWVGRPWLETVGQAGSEKILRMIEDTRSIGVSAFRHVVQRFPSGRELPFEYTTIPDKNGGLIAIGKNLQVVAELQTRLIAAQQATEREYWKLRDVETRYRLLFDVSNEAVLMVEGEDLRIVEANPAAVRALGLAPGWDFSGALAPQERDAFLSMLQHVREQGRAPGLVLHLGPSREPWAVRATLMAAEPGLRYLLHIAPAGTRPAPAAEPPSPPVTDLMERLPDGFVVMDGEGTVLHANPAFLELVQAGSAGSVQGEQLGRWLAQPGADASMLLSLLRRHGTVRLFEAALSGQLGLETRVEVSASTSGTGTPGYVCAVMRDIGRRAEAPRTAAGAEPDLATIMAAVAGQLGHTPLLQAVKTATDAMERCMIRAALDKVGGNRTAAAELLGVSRQSLHTKLNRQAAEAGPAGDSPADIG